VAAVAGVSAIRVLIVDDDALVRAGLAMMLGGAEDIEIVGQADDGTQVLAAIDTHRPDVVLMDIRMPKLDGLAATRLVRARPGAPQIIVLTTFDVDDHVLTALRHGAAGFLVKDTPPTQLLDAIRAAAAGGSVISPATTRRLVDHLVAARIARERPVPRRLDSLTGREREVLTLVARGCSNREISARLRIAELTTKTHVSRVLMKTRSRDRAQLVVLAYEAGLVRPGWNK